MPRGIKFELFNPVTSRTSLGHDKREAMTVTDVFRSVRGGQRRTAESRELTRSQRLGYGVAGVVVLLAGWESAARLGVVNPRLTSYPTEVAVSAVELWREGLLGPALLESGRLYP